MEKYRFYLDLPGDFWEGGQLMRYIREQQVGQGLIIGADSTGVECGWLTET
jgi:hypothetical protein